jgi:MerR family transcriptional regulator, redox-sensitive transcriptional activator SoxR
VALVGTGRTAVAILELAALSADDVVLVTAAAGGIGALLVQAARRAGAVVVGVAGGPAKLDQVRAWQDRELTVGQLAAPGRRRGLRAALLRGPQLTRARRTAGNQRRYPRDTLRRIAFIRVAQRVGIPLATIQSALASLPSERTPTAADWARLSAAWRAELDDRITRLTQLRDDFTDCIGCGCLSLERCRLANPQDAYGKRGAGPQRLGLSG